MAPWRRAIRAEQNERRRNGERKRDQRATSRNRKNSPRP
ncbi:flagellar biosynthetic FlhB domain protein [Desulfovibrio sp. A2]|nr:flagellar biosynthetic FlhB domain protein [Desulfovibrio sp. A2]